jgi:hypothetical protein
VEHTPQTSMYICRSLLRLFNGRASLAKTERSASAETPTILL